MTMTVGGTSGLVFPDSSTQNTAAKIGMVNRIINGAMMIDQRNAGASVNPTDGQYTVDRWQASRSQASKLTVQQNAGSVTPPAGYINYLGVTSSSAYSVVAADYFLIGQPIEGLNVSDLGWGAAGAASVTLSFWVRSSLTGTFGGSVNNSGNTRSYPFSYTISTANTWEQKTITIAGDTSGTWLKTNGVGLFLRFGLGVGSTASGTANTWASAAYFAPTGATSVVGTNGATFYITGVQLEKGTSATPFEYRDYGRELQMCQRYYNVTRADIGWVICQSDGANAYAFVSTNFPVAMRTSPTVSNIAFGNGGTSSTFHGFSNQSTYGYTTRVNTASAGTSSVFGQTTNAASSEL